jgi:type VI protein secretion system component VasK
LLESPIKDAKRWISTDPSKQVKANIDGAQQAFCKELSGLSRKYPFNRKATEENDARPEDVAKVFAPQNSAFATLKMALGDNVTKSGNTWTQKPDAPVKLSASFLSFFNRASDISETLFQGGSLSMRYKLMMKPNPAVKQITGLIDSAPLSTVEKEYAWSPSNPKIELRVDFREGGNAALRSFSGPWATFRLLSGADKINGREFALIYVLGAGANPQAIFPDGPPITLSVAPFPNDINPFDPAFFQIACPGRATQ